MTSLPSPSSANAAESILPEIAIKNSCISGNLSQLRLWAQQGIQMSTPKILNIAEFFKAPLDVLSCLVNELGVDVNQRNESGVTALFMACFAGHHDILRFMVEELGADVNIPDNLGETPLYTAALRGQLDVVRVLLKLGADISMTSKYGITPLMVATYWKKYEVVEWLVKAGADTQMVFKDIPDATATVLLPNIARIWRPRRTVRALAAAAQAS
jgi:ankyrin repeat protein